MILKWPFFLLSIFLITSCVEAVPQQQSLETNNVISGKNEADYIPSMTSVGYENKHIGLCGSKNWTEEKIYKKYSRIENIRTKRVKFLLNVAVCNDLSGNYGLALKDAESIVYLSDIWNDYSEEYVVALSMLATHSFADELQSAWAYSRLRQEDLTLYDNVERTAIKNKGKIAGGELTHMDYFRFQRLEKFKETK